MAVRDNKDRSRFELDAGNEIAFANYRLTPSAVIITHTETPRALRGRGIALRADQGCAGLDPPRRQEGDRRLWLRRRLSRQASGGSRPRRLNAKGAREIAGPLAYDRAIGQCLISGGSLPPLAASLDITCLCSQTFMLAESFMSPL